MSVVKCILSITERPLLARSGTYRLTMRAFHKFMDKVKRFNAPIESWYSVQFDENLISISASPPGRERWESYVRWDDIIRVIFQGEGAECSDGVYLFSNIRAESYVVPTDCAGGKELIDELISRGIFGSKLFTEAVVEPYGIYCWPDDEHECE